MSNTIPISKIAAYKHGDALASVSGMLENVWERKTGVTKGRPWSIQNLMLKDATGTIKVTLFGRKECSSNMEGKQVELLGVFVDDNTHNGKTTRVVKVTEDSAVKQIGNSQHVAQPPTPAASNSGGKMVHGATVGMAINNAVHIISIHEKGLDYYAGDDFIFDLHGIAKSIIYVSTSLESGEELKRPEAAPAVHNGPDFNHSEPRPAPDDGNFLQEGEEAF